MLYLAGFQHSACSEVYRDEQLFPSKLILTFGPYSSHIMPSWVISMRLWVVHFRFRLFSSGCCVCSVIPEVMWFGSLFLQVHLMFVIATTKLQARRSPRKAWALRSHVSQCVFQQLRPSGFPVLVFFVPCGPVWFCFVFCQNAIWLG